MTPRGRLALAWSGALAWWLVSCRDIPSPEGGILSLSPVLLPSPGLVVNDTMRDSTGVVAPLRVIAYDLAGDAVQNPVVTFVVIDTAPGARLAGRFLIGIKEGTTVRVIASTEAIQTQPAKVVVTLSPDTMLAADSIVHRRSYSLLAGDTVVDANLSTTVLHRGAASSGVEAVVVRYAIDKAPPGANNAQTVLLLNGAMPSDRDTSDATGRVSRLARLRTTAKSTFATDTALVTATASYAGRTIGRILFALIYTSR